MPGGDQTGPMGMGSMTGRGMGVCIEASAQEGRKGAPGRGRMTNSRQGLGRGYGKGCGRVGMGFGRGLGRKNNNI